MSPLVPGLNGDIEITRIKWEHLIILHKKELIMKKINIIYKNNGGNNDMIKLFRKTLAICLIGLGLGILLVLLLPITGWLFIIGVVVICVGFMWLAC